MLTTAQHTIATSFARKIGYSPVAVCNPIPNVWLRAASLGAGLLLLRCGEGKHADFSASAGTAGIAGALAAEPPLNRGGVAGISALAGRSGIGGLAGAAGGIGGNAGNVSAGRGGSPETAAGSAGTAAGASGTQRCSGKPGALSGKSDQQLMAAGLDRSFVYYAPANLDPNVPAPIVIVPHGWLMSAQQMFDITQYNSIADSEGFVLMYPNGEPGALGPWNVGEGACPSSLAILPLATGDDQAFIDAMIAFAEEDRCIDRKHVFVSGFSMGGYFSNEVGCLRDDIAAIGPHSGGSHDLDGCATKHKPAIIFHGMADGLIPVACGKEARDRWAERNGCSTEIETKNVRAGHCEYSKGCPADGQVVLCLFDGMDHGWAGGQGSFGFPDYESASKLGWEFFKKYAW